LSTRFQIQALSAISLVLLLAIFVTGARLIIHNPGLTLLFLLCAAAIILGGWIMLRSKTGHWWWGAVLSGIALIATFVLAWALFANRQNIRWLLLLTVLAIAYSAIIGVLSRKYWLTRRAEATTAAPRQSSLIINPKSGDGRATKAHLADIAKSQGISAIVMQPGQDLVELAETALRNGAQVLGISGGDGSLGVLAGVAMKHNVPLVVLPGGTRCHFARDIGLNPETIIDALAGFQGVERRVDVGIIGERVFLNNASFGLYAHIIGHEDYRENKLDVTTRITRDLISSEQPYYALQFRDGAGKAWRHAAQVLVGVNRYETFKLDELGKRKRLDEGILQMIAIRALDNRLLKLLGGSIDLARSNPAISQWTSREFTVSDPSGQVRVGIDGESVTLPSPVRVHIKPQALRLMVPAEGERSRPVKPISGQAAETLWNLATGREP
jgi:diacylglycerol kinase family enzyme